MLFRSAAATATAVTREIADTLRLVARLARVNELSPDRAGHGGKQQGPPVRILRSSRNPVDVFLSRHKHKHRKNNNAHHIIEAHCNIDDTKCLQKHNVGNNQTIDNTDRMYKEVYSLWKHERDVDDWLVEMGIPTAFVTYDKLFYPDTEAEGEREWNRALRFVRGGPVHPEDVRGGDSDNNNGNQLRRRDGSPGNYKIGRAHV